MMSSRTTSSSSNESGPSRRRPMEYLQVDTSSTFMNNTRHSEELPENFLEPMSPPKPAAPQLSSLTPVNSGSMYAYVKNEPENDYMYSSSQANLLMPVSEHQESLVYETSPISRANEGSSVLKDLLMRTEYDPLIDGSDEGKFQRSGSELSMGSTHQGLDFDNVPYAENFHEEKKPFATLHQSGSLTQTTAPMTRGASLAAARRTYSTLDPTDPLNAMIGREIFVDTREVCDRVTYELKTHSIPQAIFAERILCRSQGTLSDLLRNPKPWDKLKAGRQTFRRMYNWISKPLETRLAILDMKLEDSSRALGMSPPTTTQKSRVNRKSTSKQDDGPSAKRTRLVFTDIQKRTLQAIYKETHRPSREMQQTIAEHLKLDLSTVGNFFMNARRRNRQTVRNVPSVQEAKPFEQADFADDLNAYVYHSDDSISE